MNFKLKARVLYNLFPSSEIADLIFDEVFVGLRNRLEPKSCFSEENNCPRVRKINYKSARDAVESFLTYENPDCYDKIKSISNKNDMDLTIDTILKGYTICFIPETFEYEVTNLFTDKRSIFYALDSIFD